MNSRRITLIVAVVLAVGSGFLTLRYFQSVAPPTQAKVEYKPVVIAATNIPARTKISPLMLQVTQRPVNELDPDAVTDPKLAQGAISLITIPAGSVLTHSKIGQAVDAGLAPSLKPGQRAISIALDRVKGVSGLIQPGDKVDVIAVPPRSGSTVKGVAILRDITVLALGTSTETSNTGASPSPDNSNAPDATLAVTPQQADLLTAADLNTVLRLSLRPPTEPANSQPVEALTFPVPPAPGGPKAVAANAPAAGPAKPKGPIVDVVAGDNLQHVAVGR